VSVAEYVMQELGFLPFSTLGPRKLRPNRPALAFQRKYVGPGSRSTPVPVLTIRDLFPGHEDNLRHHHANDMER
jgi:hypothetical protein